MTKILENSVGINSFRSHRMGQKMDINLGKRSGSRERRESSNHKPI